MLAKLPPEARAEVLEKLSADEQRLFPWDWRNWWAREDQLAPLGDDWGVWLVLAGRGFGKSRTGAEWVREQVETGKSSRIALVAPTAADIRDVLVEGPSGILNICPDDNRPTYEPSKRHKLTWPNGAVAYGYSADEPERLRGPQHDAAWCDEIASWRYPDAWDMLMFGLRGGTNPRVVVTTTPKPVKIIRDLLSNPDCVVTRGTTYANRANLAPTFLDTIIKRYEGTRLGRQELNAELLDDVPGALWNRALLESCHVNELPQLIRVVVAIDPAVTSGDEADETGIIVAGLGRDRHGYVIDDQSGRYAPIEWARKAIKAHKDHKADRIVAEINNGGEMVEATIRMVNSTVSYKGVHATRGKVKRAEPVAALYEQSRVHHVGTFSELEDQMCAFTSDFDTESAGYSPDRVDALVWALTELMVDGPAPVIVSKAALARSLNG